MIVNCVIQSLDHSSIIIFYSAHTFFYKNVAGNEKKSFDGLNYLNNL
jgi:hypothetical protein